MSSTIFLKGVPGHISVLHKCYTSVTQVLHECYISVTQVLHECYMSVTAPTQKGAKTGPKWTAMGEYNMIWHCYFGDKGCSYLSPK